MSSQFTSSVAKSEDKSKGGYDYQLFSDLPSDDYICLICNLLAREAHQANCCGKIFCKKCLEESMRVNHICPHCGEDLNGKYYSDRRVTLDSNRLQVYCKNKEGGCKWKGELRHAETHHHTCPYLQVQCPNQCAKAVRKYGPTTAS